MILQSRMFTTTPREIPPFSLTKVKVPSMPYYWRITRRGKVIPFPSVLVLYEMKTVLFRIWTIITVIQLATPRVVQGAEAKYGIILKRFFSLIKNSAQYKRTRKRNDKESMILLMPNQVKKFPK